MPEQITIWAPQPQQAKFIQCPADDVGFGGARGGGKSDAVIGDWINHSHTYKDHAIGLMVRRQRTELVELIERAKTILLPLKFKWYEQDKVFKSPDGSRLRFSYLESDSDADAYQGHNYSRVYIEEAGTFPNEAPINKLWATLRSGHGVPCQMKSTCNPGGPGHQWVKSRYRLSGRPEKPIYYEVSVENPFTKKISTITRVFIPSKVVDNKYIDQERYVAGLQQTGSAQLVDAWLHGDWDVIQGAFFDCWNYARHVVKPFEIPTTWLRFRSGDWGSAKPFSIGWWAVAGDTVNYGGHVIPRGALVRYREWYGASGPNTGLKLTAEQVGIGIVDRETDSERSQIKYSTLDPAAFAQDGGPSIAERMATATKGKVQWMRADNKRVARKGALGGWDIMRQRLVGDAHPMAFCFDTCKDSIRTIPALQHDPDNPEDLDTDGEDHAGDEWRYACMSRPWVAREAKAPASPSYDFQAPEEQPVDGPKIITRSTETIRQILDKHFKRRKQKRRFG